MKKHCQHVHNAVSMLLAEAVIRILAEGKHVTWCLLLLNRNILAAGHAVLACGERVQSGRP